MLAAAKKRGVQVTKEQVQRFLGSKGEGQTFLPLPPGHGKTASEGPYVRLMMDLADMREKRRPFGKAGRPLDVAHAVDHLIWLGDLNYRVALPPEEALLLY